MPQHRTHRPRDIERVQAQREDLLEVITDPLAPPIRHARELHELPRLDHILNQHERHADP